MSLIARNTDLGYQGVDCAGIISSQSAKTLASLGMSFVGRYFNWKLSSEEVKGLHAAGLAVLIFCEGNTDDLAKGASKGTEHGQYAMKRASEVGVPEGVAIYFCADFDAQPRNFDAIEAYLNAATKELDGKYLTGLYGSAGLIEEMASRKAADCFCQAAAQGWYMNSKLSTYTNMYQYAWEQDTKAREIARQVGFNVDLDTCADLGAAGMWLADGTSPKRGATRHETNVKDIVNQLYKDSVSTISEGVFVPRTVAPFSDEYWWRSECNPCISRMNGTVLPNCFSGSTQIITSQGVLTLKKAFEICQDGRSIDVPTSDGDWHHATVKYFGTQMLYKVKFENSTYLCTGNHRWLVQTKRGLRAIRTLDLLPSMKIPYRMCNTEPYTHPVSVHCTGKSEGVYCVVEPNTRSFTLVGGEITGNCVGYAHGRFSEILGRFHPDLPTCDAGNWIEDLKKKKTDLTWGQTPKLGAVAVWKKHGSAGHVAIVEYINSDGTIMLSQSSYNGNWNTRFYNSGPRSEPNWYNDGTYSFQGFIYNPACENITIVAPYENPVEYGTILSTDCKRYSEICSEYLLGNSTNIFDSYSSSYQSSLVNTYYTSSGYKVPELHPAQKLVQAAFSHLGRGSHDWVLDATSVRKNQGWSAAMICAAAKECDFAKLKFPKDKCVCSELMRYLVEKQNGKYITGGARGGSEHPQIGDIFAVYTGSIRSFTKYSATRVGIVRGVQDDVLLTVEGDLQDSILLNQRRLKDISYYVRPDWKQENASEECTSLFDSPIYDTLNTKEDMTLREVGYLDDDGKPSIKPTDIRLSAINYTTTLSHVMAFYAMTDDRGIKSSSTGKKYIESDKDSVDTSRLQPSNARIICDFLLGKGMTAAQAVGFLANIQAESNFDTDSVDDATKACGICHWSGDRRNKMIDSMNGKWSSNLSGQLEFLWNELSGSKSKVASKLKSDVTSNDELGAMDALKIVCLEYLDLTNSDASERRGFVSSIWSMLTVLDSSTGKYKSEALSNDIRTRSGMKITVGESIPIPSWVNQSGISSNSSPYDTLFPRWARSLPQGKLADLWDEQGRPTKYTIATLNGYFIGGCTTKFGVPGDIVSVVLDDNSFFNMIIGDSKGADAHDSWAANEDGNEYGHYLGDKNLKQVDVIEWESDFSIPNAQQARIAGLKEAGFYGRKVIKVVNYGSWLDR